MKYQYETVLRPDGECFQLDTISVPVLNCPYHVHPEHELTWVESSFGVRIIGDNISDFRENDLVLMGPMLPHIYMNSPADSLGPEWSRQKVVKFGEEFLGLLNFKELEPVRDLFNASESGVVFPDIAATRIAPLFAEVFMEGNPFRLVRLLELLVLLAEATYEPLCSGSPVGSVLDARMRRALDHIHSALLKGHSASLNETAEAACMTPQAFSRFFHKGTHKRFIDYVTELKIGRACCLLRDGDLPILDLSLESGFRNLSNFNRHFSRLKGLTPRQYRKAFRTSAESK